MLQYYMKITHVLYILLYHSVLVKPPLLIGCIHLLMHYNSEDEGEAEDFISHTALTAVVNHVIVLV